MRTREELQGWIRSGMPVPGEELERPEAGRCTAFVVAVERAEGRLAVLCQGCGRGTAVGGIQATTQDASGVWTAVRDVRVWMTEHAKDALGYTRAARHFRDSEEHGSVMRVWAGDLMVRGTSGGAGRLSVGEEGEDCDCAIYLEPGPAVYTPGAGWTGAGSEPFKRGARAGAAAGSAGKPE